tara:strand:- start:3666 stop:6800 length:3135 start_codon:yes stop_codon:yes gene_type:complete
MINLTPIPKNIQKRLFEKMRILGRTESAIPNTPKNGDLTHDKLAIRTTFLRMTSGQLNPVVIAGGKLKNDLTMAGGYDDIYGPRTYAVQDDELEQRETQKYQRGTGPSLFDDMNEEEIFRAGQVGLTDYKTVNRNKRPLPGVVSIDASFRGGMRALREATIKWTCWDWDELELLTPHFLAHGKTVMVEWGWVYDDKTLLKLPNFLKTDVLGNRYISADAYNNYRNKIVDADGDFDLMVGIIKNFEFTTRDDGGFDCQTIISSVGASIIENPEPNKTIVDPSITYNMSIKDKDEEIKEKLENTLGGESTTNTLIKFNTNVTLQAFLHKIDDYLYSIVSDTRIDERYTFDKNKFIIKKDPAPGKKTGYYAGEAQYAKGGYTIPKEAWVRWGWFEDNILSKFLTVTSDDGDSPIITEFRSVERQTKSGGKETDVYESTKIRNHDKLETTDIKSYILPGQFFPMEKRILKREDKEDIVLPGDVKLKGLNTILKDIENFESFAVRGIVEEYTGTLKQNVMLFKTNPEIKGKPFSVRKQFWIENIGKTDGSLGYLRNMLIHTQSIKDAFGVNDSEATIDAHNVFEGITRLFNNLNQTGGLNFWNFELVVDETDTHRIKIIDNATTYVDFNKPIQEQRTKVNTLGEIDKNEGIFFFPVWQSDSLVKRQNITAKLPSALQLATMYGSNADALKGFGDHAGTYVPEAVALGALSNDSPDKNKEGLDIALKNDKSKNIGLKSGDSTQALTLDDGENIIDFLNTSGVIEVLNKSYNQNLEKINEKIEANRILARNKDIDNLYDESLPPPMVTYMTDAELLRLLDSDSELYDDFGPDEATRKRAGSKLALWMASKVVPGPVKDINSAKYKLIEELKSLFGSKFDKALSSGDAAKMKPEFLDFLKRSINKFGASNKETLPLMIPLELELEIDGIGGIYPGNSYHSTYIPRKYQKYTVFQAFDVNHTLDGSGWTTTILGKMRSTLATVFDSNTKFQDIRKELVENYEGRIEQKKQEAQQKKKESRPDTETLTAEQIQNRDVAKVLAEARKSGDMTMRR